MKRKGLTKTYIMVYIMSCAEYSNVTTDLLPPYLPVSHIASFSYPRGRYDVRHIVKLCIVKRRDYATVDLASIGHHQTQQSITYWRMITGLSEIFCQRSAEP